MKTLNGSMDAMDGQAYFVKAVSYVCKMFMKLTTTHNVIKLFSSVVYEFL